MICCVCSERKQKTKKKYWIPALPSVALGKEPLPSAALGQAGGARQRFYLKKTNFSSLPSVLLEALGKEIFKKKLVSSLPSVVLEESANKISEKMFCALPSARLEALSKEGVTVHTVTTRCFSLPKAARGARQRLCRVPDKRRSAKEPLPSVSLPGALCRALPSLPTANPRGLQ